MILRIGEISGENWCMKIGCFYPKELITAAKKFYSKGVGRYKFMVSFESSTKFGPRKVRLLRKSPVNNFFMSSPTLKIHLHIQL